MYTISLTLGIKTKLYSIIECGVEIVRSLSLKKATLLVNKLNASTQNDELRASSPHSQEPVNKAVQPGSNFGERTPDVLNGREIDEVENVCSTSSSNSQKQRGIGQVNEGDNRLTERNQSTKEQLHSEIRDSIIGSAKRLIDCNHELIDCNHELIDIGNRAIGITKLSLGLAKGKFVRIPNEKSRRLPQSEYKSLRDDSSIKLTVDTTLKYDYDLDKSDF
ncbi:MAG: hypothetical protein ACRC80_26685 [Waterburya sp.]